MFHETRALALLLCGLLVAGCERGSPDHAVVGENPASPGPASHQAAPAPAANGSQGSVPATAPRFEDYPSGPLYAGPTASLADSNDGFRTRHADALASNEIVFASEYVIATIGCGTGCVFQDFISKRTGALLKDGFGRGNEERIKEVRADSRLVMTAGPNDEDEGDPSHFAYYYVLENGRLNRIAKVPTTLAECEGMLNCTVDTPY